MAPVTLLGPAARLLQHIVGRRNAAWSLRLPGQAHRRAKPIAHGVPIKIFTPYALVASPAVRIRQLDVQRIEASELPEATRLISLATAVPEFEIDQTVAEASSRAWFGDRMPNYDRVPGVCATPAMQRRYSVGPVG